MIAIVIPTIRPDHFEKFTKVWQPLFDKHDCKLVVVQDGENPTVNGFSTDEVMGEYKSVLSNFNAGIRNLGFAYVAKELKDIEFIITLDDDVTPIGDPIQDHLDALKQSVPISWISTASEYTRGFPYTIRKEAEVMISHGVWEGSADWDAPTQLVMGEKRPIDFYRGPIPKGTYYPMCSMNLAFKRNVLPYIYHAPWAMDVHRFDDIFAGIVSKRELDKLGWAVVSGYSVVHHERASDPFKNLRDEALGIYLNETFWQGDESHPYFKEYFKKYELWKEFISKTGLVMEIEKDPLEFQIEESKLQEAKPQKTEQKEHKPEQKNIQEMSFQKPNTAMPVKVINPEINLTPNTKTVQNDVNAEENRLKVLNYWREWIPGNARAYHNPRWLLSRFTFMLGDEQEVRIANLGAGPVNMIGNEKKGKNLKVVASDPLADEYNKMLNQAGLMPRNPVEKQNMENLTYENASFDIVYSDNALYYLEDPYKALQEMLRICKPDGYIYIRHNVYKGSGNKPLGEPKWDISSTKSGGLIFKNVGSTSERKEFALSDIYPGFITEVEELPKGNLYTSFVKKS